MAIESDRDPVGVPLPVVRVSTRSGEIPAPLPPLVLKPGSVWQGVKIPDDPYNIGGDVAKQKQLALYEHMSETGLRLPAGIPYESWAEGGHTLASMRKTLGWWIGDWLNYGEQNYSEQFSQAASETGLHPETLRKYQWVSSRIPFERRRKPPVEYSHHELVAGMEPAEQGVWLDQVEANNWTVAELRRELKEDKGTNPGTRDGTHYTCPKCEAALVLTGEGLIEDSTPQNEPEPEE